MMSDLGSDAEFEAALEAAYLAARTGEVGGLPAVFQAYPRIVRDLQWAQPLMERAADHGRPAMLAALLDAGVPADLIGDGGITVLMRAAYSGNAEVVRLLLGAGADPDALPEDHEPDIDPKDLGQSALFCALEQGHREAARLLQSATSPAVARRARAALKRLRRAEGDETGRDGATGRRSSPKFQAELHWAIFEKHPERIAPALAAGADIDARDFQDKSLLWHAAYHGNRELARLLLDHGASPDAPGDPDEQTPLMIAIRMGQSELIGDLIRAGADPGRKDRSGRSAWDSARRPLCQDGNEALRRAWREVRGSEPPD
jgi:ankyrin repeat protein